MKRITSFFAVLLIAMTAFAVDFTGGEFHINTTGANDLGGPNYQYSAINAVFLNGTTESTVAAVQTGDKNNCTWSVQVPEGTWSTFSLVDPYFSTVLAADLEFDGTNNVIIVTQTGRVFSASFNGSQGTVPTLVAAEPEPEEPIVGAAVDFTGGEFHINTNGANDLKGMNYQYSAINAVFLNGTTESTVAAVKTGDKNNCTWSVQVPEGTWSTFSLVLPAPFNTVVAADLEFDGTNNVIIVTQTSGAYSASFNGSQGTVPTSVAAEPEPEEPIVGATIYFDFSLNTSFKVTSPIVFVNGETTDTVTLAAIEGVTNVFTAEVPVGEWEKIEILDKVAYRQKITLTNYDGVKNMFKVFPATGWHNILNLKAATDGDGVWMNYGENFSVGSNIMAKQVVYFDPIVEDVCDTYEVIFVEYGNKKVAKVAAMKLADGVYSVTAGNMIYTSFNIRAYNNDQLVASVDNLTWDGAGKKIEVDGTWVNYTEPERIMTATWTMEEGASVTGFSSVRVTFGGIDQQGRVLGQNATKVTYAGSTAPTFYKVENGTRTEVAVEENSGHIAGKLDYTQIDNFTYEFSVGEYFERFEEGYMRPGEYCIVINGTNLTIDPKVSGKAVKGSGEFVLNFTIANGKVFFEPTEASYETTPSSNVVNEISEVILEFEAPIEFVEGRSATPDPKSWPFIQGASVGGVYYPMNCEIIGDDYELKLTIASEYVDGVDKITAEGLYTITIPEGMLSYGDNLVNKEIALSYTIGTAMPANGVIYFDPAGKFTQDLTVRFIGADGSVKDAADVINLGEIYRITMPAGNEWMRFEVDAWGDDPATTESNFVQLYLVSGLVYTGEYNLFTLNADAPNQATAENGVWSNHVAQPIQGGSVFFYSLAESAYFSEAEDGKFAWKVFFVNAEGTEAEVEMELIDGAMYRIVAPEGTWDMLHISLHAAASGSKVNEFYLENDGEHNMFKLGEDASHSALVGSWDVYNTEVIATWSIEEGEVLESFTSVTVTFSGMDSVGRMLDGVEVTEVVSATSAVKILYSVAEDGTATEIGILPATKNGLSITYAVAEDKGYNLVNGELLSNGKYRIVIPEGKLTFNPRRNENGANLPPVRNDKEFVLNFSIVNDYVEPEPVTEVEVPFTVSVENNSTVAELSEIVITYPDARIRVSEPMAPQSQLTWVFLNNTMVDENGNVTASEPMAPLYWQQISANSFKVMVNLSANGGPETLTAEGTYSIDVPAGLVMFSETTVNKAFSLYYTIKAAGEDGPTVDVENVTLSNIFVQNGMIMADGEFEIFTITGQNVTDMNGNLQNGVYVVRNANAATKVIVK